MVNLFQLCTARANHVEATGVAILVNEILGQLHVVVVNEAARTHQETIDLVVLVHLLHGIVDTTDDVVAARSLSAREDDAHVHLVGGFLVTRHEFYQRHSVCVREKLLDLFLVTYALCRLAFLDFNGTLQAPGELGLILRACLLQKTCLH